ncbi:hypothetical protein [Vibrio sp. DW001]|uniref:hypothetical protein n=1 Tax=Vibrio sp. DW001 TaxID=2912315 RepID=UPI00318422BC
MMAAQNSSISELVNDLPQRYTYSDRIQNFAVEKSQSLIEKGQLSPQDLIESLGFEHIIVEGIDSTDGLRILLTDRSKSCKIKLR